MVRHNTLTTTSISGWRNNYRHHTARCDGSEFFLNHPSEE